MSLFALIKPKGPSGFGFGSTAEDVTAGLSLQGKTVLITGCNSGLGHETMRVLASRGAYVIGAARDEAKAASACRAIGGQASGIACDLANPASIRACVAELKSRKARLDVIICNAGIMAPPDLRLACGYEQQFFVNHIGHFILVTGLLAALADDARVVVLSSLMHWMAPRGGIEFDNLTGGKGYAPMRAYGQSKFANLLFAKELARRFAGTSRTANALHPGVIPTTNLFKDMYLPWPIRQYGPGLMTALICKNVRQGAATSCYVAANPKAAGLSGQYFADCNVSRPRSDANDPALSQRLWDVSEKIVSGVSRRKVKERALADLGLAKNVVPRDPEAGIGVVLTKQSDPVD
jgi:NAD(P)-dependent dehydrogenase (short-subunit alcohol dehydrogenase family)